MTEVSDRGAFALKPDKVEYERALANCNDEIGRNREIILKAMSIADQQIGQGMYTLGANKPEFILKVYKMIRDRLPDRISEQEIRSLEFPGKEAATLKRELQEYCDRWKAGKPAPNEEPQLDTVMKALFRIFTLKKTIAKLQGEVDLENWKELHLGGYSDLRPSTSRMGGALVQWKNKDGELAAPIENKLFPGGDRTAQFLQAIYTTLGQRVSKPDQDPIGGHKRQETEDPGYDLAETIRKEGTEILHPDNTTRKSEDVREWLARGLENLYRFNPIGFCIATGLVNDGAQLNTMELLRRKPAALEDIISAIRAGRSISLKGLEAEPLALVVGSLLRLKTMKRQQLSNGSRWRQEAEESVSLTYLANCTLGMDTSKIQLNGGKVTVALMTALHCEMHTTPRTMDDVQLYSVVALQDIVEGKDLRAHVIRPPIEAGGKGLQPGNMSVIRKYDEDVRHMHAWVGLRYAQQQALNRQVASVLRREEELRRFAEDMRAGKMIGVSDLKGILKEEHAAVVALAGQINCDASADPDRARELAALKKKLDDVLTGIGDLGEDSGKAAMDANGLAGTALELMKARSAALETISGMLRSNPTIGKHDLIVNWEGLQEKVDELAAKPDVGGGGEHYAQAANLARQGRGTEAVQSLIAGANATNDAFAKIGSRIVALTLDPTVTTSPYPTSSEIETALKALEAGTVSVARLREVITAGHDIFNETVEKYPATNPDGEINLEGAYEAEKLKMDNLPKKLSDLRKLIENAHEEELGAIPERAENLQERLSTLKGLHEKVRTLEILYIRQLREQAEKENLIGLLQGTAKEDKLRGRS